MSREAATTEALRGWVKRPISTLVCMYYHANSGQFGSLWNIIVLVGG